MSRLKLLFALPALIAGSCGYPSTWENDGPHSVLLVLDGNCQAQEGDVYFSIDDKVLDVDFPGPINVDDAEHVLHVSYLGTDRRAITYNRTFSVSSSDTIEIPCSVWFTE